MKFNQEVFHRKSIRLRGYDYSQPGAYFVTICTHQRQALFGEIVDGEMHLNAAGVVVAMVWQELPSHYANVELGEFIVMPNHFHGVVRFNGAVGAIHESPVQSQSPAYDESNKWQRRKMGLSKLMGRFKMVSSKQINQLRNNPGCAVWQRNYHEHIIRNESAYLKIAEYIQTNPLQWQDDTYHVGANDYSPYGLT